ncbi:MAG: diaminopimelate epimerase [Burkholderiales bacterium]
MTKIYFNKMHGLGNDFILIDTLAQPLSLTAAQIQFICNRKLGIGADQLLLIEQSSSSKADYNYRIFNQDGNEVEQCGNGARCAISYLYSHYSLTHNAIRLQTKNRIIVGSIDSNHHITISMGNPKFAPTDLPFSHPQHLDNQYQMVIAGKLATFGIASVGNPHVIIQLAALEELANSSDLATIAKSIQRSSYFPEGVNVNFYWPQDRNTIYLYTYERGCGFTLACGTGACATVCYGISRQLLTSSVCVKMPGGSLNITWDNTKPDAQILMTGPATQVFQGQIELCS